MYKWMILLFKVPLIYVYAVRVVDNLQWPPPKVFAAMKEAWNCNEQKYSNDITRINQ